MGPGPTGERPRDAVERPRNHDRAARGRAPRRRSGSLNARRLIAIVLVLAAAGGGAWYYRGLHREPVAAGHLVLYGNIDIREVDLAFDTQGRVAEMKAEEGDRVIRGQLLATLDASRYQARLAAAEHRIGTARAALDRLVAGSRPEEIQKAQADVDVFAVDVRNAREKLDRVRDMAARKFASQQDLDDARAALDAAQGRLRSAREVLALAVAGPRKEDIEQARAQLSQAQADAALANEDLKDTKLYAPADGTVLTRIVEPGAVVMATTPVYTIALADPMWVRAYVSETDLGRVRPGEKAAISTDSFPGRVYAGWVGYVSPVAEFTPKTVETPELRTSLVYQVRIYVRNPDETLRQGMPVTVTLAPAKGG